MVDESGMIKIGPVASSGYDDAWDEKGHTNIVQIFVSHNVHGIKSIQFQYAENGGLVLSPKHGTKIGDKFDAVMLNHPNETITWISGVTDNAEVLSLKFGTNRGEYGPFGSSSSASKMYYNREFCFKIGEAQQFGGFHGIIGIANNTFQSIGIYLKPVSSHITTSASTTTTQYYPI